MNAPTFALIAFVAAIPLRAAEAEYKQITVTPGDGFVEVRLPLTDVTGPARVKQRADDGFGVPIAPSRTNLDGSCYLEWQISYDTTGAEHPSIVREVKFQRDGRTKTGCELSKILLCATEQHVVSRDDLKRLRAELDELHSVDLESAERIALEPDTQSSASVPKEFSRFTQRVPQFAASTPGGSVEIQFKPKQHAIGYQPMVYVCLPSKAWRQSDGTQRRAGKARVKETVHFRFGAAEKGLLLSIVRAFAIASKEHNQDLAKILDAILAVTAGQQT